MKLILIALLFGLVIYTLGHASGPSDEQMAWVEYCEMVAIYKETNGENGWPDFRDIYEDQCK